MKDALGDSFSDVSGASVRKGCISECASEMPAEHTAVASGHALRGVSAMWEYFSWTLAAGANAWNHIAGWAPRPWGQCGTVAKPASLDPLLQIGIDQTTLDHIVDDMFRINDSSCPHLRSLAWEPAADHPHHASLLQKRAEARPFVQAAFASMLMYYKERLENQQMIDINRTLETVVRVRLNLTGDVHSLLVSWGSHIRNDFLRNNAHLLTTSSTDSAENQILQTMKLMAETIGQQRVQLAQQSEKMDQMNKTLTCVVTTLLDLQNTMKQNTDFAVHCMTSKASPVAEDPDQSVDYWA